MLNEIVSKMKKIDKKEILISIFFLILSLISFNFKFIFGDELWNFANICKMCHGQVLYNDVNVIIFPLFFYVGKLFLNIFGANYHSFLYYGVIIFFFYLEMNYIFIKKIFKNRRFSVALVSVLFIAFLKSFATANYTMFAMALYMLGMFYLVKKPKNYLIQSIIIVLILLSKQNIGFYYVLSFIVYMLFKSGSFKEKVLYILKTGLISLGIFLVFLGILYLKGNLFEFLNYTILGMFDFTNQNKQLVLIGCILVVLWMVNVCLFFVNYFYNKKKKEFYDISLLLIMFSTFIILLFIPVANVYHSMFPLILNIITFMYFNYMIFEKKIEKLYNTESKCKTFNIIFGVIIAFSIFYVIYNIKDYCNYMLNENKIEKSDAFYGAYIDDEYWNKRDNIQKYIIENKNQGIDVIVSSNESMFYNLKLKIYNKDFDILFKGNLGYNGSNRVIDRIKKMKNKKILLKNDYFFLMDENVVNYIKDNYEKVEEIEDYSVYFVK